MARYSGPGPLTAAFLISEANGMYRSREEGDVTVPANTTLPPGTILGQTTDTGVYGRLDTAGEDGTEAAAGILFEGIYNDTDDSVTVRRTLVVRDCEVHKTELIYADGADDAAMTATDTALRGLGIIPRL